MQKLVKSQSIIPEKSTMKMKSDVQDLFTSASQSITNIDFNMSSLAIDIRSQFLPMVFDILSQLESLLASKFINCGDKCASSSDVTSDDNQLMWDYNYNSIYYSLCYVEDDVTTSDDENMEDVIFAMEDVEDKMTTKGHDK